MGLFRLLFVIAGVSSLGCPKCSLGKRYSYDRCLVWERRMLLFLLLDLWGWSVALRLLLVRVRPYDEACYLKDTLGCQ